MVPKASKSKQIIKRYKKNVKKQQAIEKDLTKDPDWLQKYKNLHGTISLRLPAFKIIIISLLVLFAFLSDFLKALIGSDLVFAFFLVFFYALWLVAETLTVKSMV